MNNFTRFIHRSVIKLNLEEFFVALRKRMNFIRRFIPLGIRHKLGSVGRVIPQHESFPPNDNHLLTRDHTRFIINRSDYVQWRLFYGVRDNYLIQAMKAVTPDSIVLDIGSNFGAFSMRLASYVLRKKYRDVQVHAFEPNPAVVKRIAENLSLNPMLSDIVKIHPVGLGSHKSKLPFQYLESNSGAGRITNSNGIDKIFIDIERIDDVVATINPPKVSFIKMIVEGFEPHVFKGGAKTIEKYKPPIFFEVTPEWYAEHNSSLSEILAQLKDLGYTFYGERYNELIKYDPQKFDSLIQYNMFAIVRK